MPKNPEARRKRNRCQTPSRNSPSHSSSKVRLFYKTTSVCFLSISLHCVCGWLHGVEGDGHWCHDTDSIWKVVVVVSLFLYCFSSLGKYGLKQLGHRLRSPLPSPPRLPLFPLPFSLPGFPRIALRTLQNPIYLLVVLAQVHLAAMIAGLATFMAKFIERQFTQTASFSNMMIGERHHSLSLWNILV